MSDPRPPLSPHHPPENTRQREIELFEGLTTTRAIRRYSEEPVSDEDLAAILFAATRAPSGSNRQPWRFLVLRNDDPSRRAKHLLAGAAREIWAQKRSRDGYDHGSGRDPDSPKARMAESMERFPEQIENAPVVILPCFLRYRAPHLSDGASIYPCCQNLLLAARARGLGGVMTIFQAPVEAELREVLAVPDGVELAAAIPLGHPLGAHGPVRRRPLREFVFEGRWGETPAWAEDPPGTRHTRAGPPGHRSPID